VRVGVVILPTMDWPDARSVWRRAEQMGAHTAWTYDHLTWRDLRDGPWFAALPLLAAIAASTETMRIGTLVTSPNFRHPVTLAKEAMTLDVIAGGRLTLGIGAGGVGWDATALGQEPWSVSERTRRFEEFVGALDQLLTPGATPERTGEFYDAVDARCLPGCVQRPRVPFAIAGGGRRAIALAARYADTWVTMGDPRRAAEMDGRECIAVVRRQTEVLDEACTAIGRDPTTLQRLYMQGATREPWLDSVLSFVELAGHYGELGMTDLALHWPRTEPPYVADIDRFEAILATAVSGSG
jgi:alkanesulfonate monooxygenase SsuD/methylene tetrahydromethanopterin reductase-like flavin-dependent oxidoreductase (luciferase family)